MTTLEVVRQVLLIGIGATVVLDLWLLVLGRMGVPTLNYAHLGRWVGHLFRGKFAHTAIAQAAPVPGELALGWLSHYLIGVAFAALLLVWQGAAWTQQPTLAPALAIGLCTVLAPLLVMQPAMGAGIASSKTATPLRNVARSVVNHLVFGLGLYLAALLQEFAS